MKILLLLSLLLSGCATCERHPYVCAAGTAIIAGSIAASVQHHHDQTTHAPAMATIQPVNCANGSCQ